MKNIASIFVFFFFAAYQVSAQFVPIPDTVFRAQLIEMYPQCFNSSKDMDTTCHAIVSTKQLLNIASSRHDGNIEGIQYFDSLESAFTGRLSWVANRFPPRIKSFTAQLGYIKTIPKLPATIEWLDLAGNELTELPALPASLEYLAVHANQLSALPNLPAGLKQIYCLGNNLTALPDLPEGLELLGMGGNPISCLPKLPSSLKELILTKQTTQCLPNEVPSLKVLTTTSAIFGNFFDRELTTVPVCSPTFDPDHCKFDVITQVRDVETNASIHVFPSPAKERLTLQVSQPSFIKLYDSKGVCVWQAQVNNIEEIDTTMFSSGMYFCKGDNGFSTTFIVE